jgi:flagellar hook-length control protein FliK
VTEQIAVQVAKAVQSDSNRITIQLKPESLGRIDVQLDIRHDGHVAASIAADKQETLDWLRRDAAHLDQALKDAGLKTDSGSLSFNLREQRTADQFGERGSGRRTQGSTQSQSEVGTDPASPPTAVWRRAAGGVDVSV